MKKLKPSEELNKMVDIMNKELAKCRIFYRPDGDRALAPKELIETMCICMPVYNGKIHKSILNQ